MRKKRKLALADDPMVRAIREHGFTKVMRATDFCISWIWVAQQIGHEPTITEFMDWWRAPGSSTFRSQQAFREVSGLDTPASIYRQLQAEGVEVESKPSKGDGLAVLSRLLAG